MDAQLARELPVGRGVDRPLGPLRRIDGVQRIVAGHQRPRRGRRGRDAVRGRPRVLNPAGPRRGREEGPRLKGQRVTGCDCAISHGLACAAGQARNLPAETPPRRGAPGRELGRAEADWTSRAPAVILSDSHPLARGTDDRYRRAPPPILAGYLFPA